MTQVEKIEKLIREGEMLKVRAGDKIANLTTQYKKKADELKDLGIDVKQAETDLEEKKKLLQEKINKALELIPEDVIEKYKNYDFAGAKETEEEPNLNMPF